LRRRRGSGLALFLDELGAFLTFGGDFLSAE
jgi:hypothetical protein